MQSRRHLPGRDDEETQDTIVHVHLLATEMTASARWSETQRKGDRREEYQAMPGSVVDLQRPHLPTSLVKHSRSNNNCEEKGRVQACTICMVGIVQDATVIVYHMTATGVMADTGANACMADSEVLLEGCHDTRPVTVGLAIASQKDQTMHTCDRMGYMLFTREDGGAHRQLFLVNHQATDCIMSSDAIARQVAGCVSWRQEGHVGKDPGLLAFFNAHGKSILHLPLRKHSSLYYCNVEGTTAPHTDDTFNRITNDWVTVVDRLHTNTEVVDVWATVARVERIQPRRLARHGRGAPQLPPKLPVLPELSTFELTLNPRAEQPFTPEKDCVLWKTPRRTRKRSMLPERPAIEPPLAEQTCDAGDGTTPLADAQFAAQTDTMSTAEAQGATVGVSTPT